MKNRTLSRRASSFLGLAAVSVPSLLACSSGSPVDPALTAPAPLDGDAVRIVSVASGKVLDVVGASRADGAPLQQWSSGGAASTNQEWRLQRDESGAYAIANVASGACLDAPAGGGDGARLQQWSCAGTDNQRWALRPAADGSVALVNLASGKCVDLAGASGDDGAVIQEWACAGAANQRWRMEPVADARAAGGAPAGSVALVSAASGKALDVAGGSTADGALVQQWTDAGGANQRWSFVPAPGGYEVVGAGSGKCLDVAGASGDDGAPLQQWTCAGGLNQIWTLRATVGGAFALVSAATGKCADVAGASVADGARLQQWGCSGGANQAFVVRAAAASPPPPPSPGGTLRAAAAAAGKWIGVALTTSRLGDATYEATAGSEFGYVTPENEMKWDATEPSPGQLDFGGGDAVVRFAAAHGQKVKGHTLVWHNQLPSWVAALTDPAAVRTAMLGHVRALVTHYRGQVAAWDVVNEAIDDAPSHAIRDDVFHRALGDGYIAEAFRAAHDADPDALLFYNDYGIEGLDGKANAMYALVKGLVAAGVPIAGVGLQTHIGVNDGPSAGDIAANMHRLAALGLLVNVSELDVNVCAGGDSLSRSNAQRQRMHDVVAACMSEPRCPSVTLWGISDRDSWLNGFAPCTPQQGGTPAGLLFDDAYARKSAWQGVADALGGR
jgi:endo-1,4-beta-xylanase